jgi:hypothetical protein
VKLAILSDIHYAGAAEQKREGYPLSHINNPLQRAAVHHYRKYFWHRDPFAHNYLLDEFIARAPGSALVVANGDYSCDSAAIGVADDAAFESARECLEKLRRAFAGNFEAVVGDHEIGKKALGSGEGGLRLESFGRLQTELSLKPFWTRQIEGRILLGVTSTLIALPVYAAEAIHQELPMWEELRSQHLHRIREFFKGLSRDQRVVLFCHDPTALPFLWREAAVREKMNQIERTVIGHLHSRLIFFKSRLLAGMPIIGFLGHTPKRLSRALREARHWKPFNVLLCPSLSGIQLLKDGGFYTVDFKAPSGKLEFVWNPLPWSKPKH